LCAFAGIVEMPADTNFLHAQGESAVMSLPDGSGPVHRGERSSSVSTDRKQPDPPGRQAADSKVGYPFIAYPVHVMNPLVHEGKLIPRDVSVLTVLISFANQFRDSCWCKPETIAEKLNCKLRTVQTSLARLSEHGVISHRKVAPRGEPELLQPSNKTGWRWVFLWNQTLRYPTEEPDRRPPMERKLPRFKDASGQMHLFASDPMQSVASEGMQSVASKSEKEAKSDSRLRKNTTTTACDGATHLPAREASPKSSSSLFLDRPLGELSIMPAILSAPAELVKRAAALFYPGGDNVREKQRWSRDELEAKFREFAAKAAKRSLSFGWDWLSAALDAVEEHNRKPDNARVWSWGFIAMTLGNFLDQGGPPPPKRTAPPPARPSVPAIAEPPPAPIDPGALRQTIAELEAKPRLDTWEVWLLNRTRRELAAAAELEFAP